MIIQNFILQFFKKVFRSSEMFQKLFHTLLLQSTSKKLRYVEEVFDQI